MSQKIENSFHRIKFVFLKPVYSGAPKLLKPKLSGRAEVGSDSDKSRRISAFTQPAEVGLREGSCKYVAEKIQDFLLFFVVKAIWSHVGRGGEGGE